MEQRSSSVQHPTRVSVPATQATETKEASLEAMPDGGVTLRVTLLALALAALFGYIIPIIDARFSNTYLGAAHLPPGAVAVLLVVLLILNPLAGLSSRRAGVRSLVLVAAFAAGVLCAGTFRLWGAASLLFWLLGALSILLLLAFLLGRRPLSRNESLTVYITCLFSCLVPGHGSENFFVSNIIGPFYFANAENKWLDFLNSLPSWFTPALQGGAYSLGHPGYDAVQSWYTGAAGAVPWAVWIGPLVGWSALVLASYVMLACLSVMLRAQWAEREALAFPLLRLPLEMTEENPQRMGMPGSLFFNRLLWIGMGLAVAIQIANGLHVYFPDVPEIPLTIKGNFFTETPWNQIGAVQFRVLLIVVGITYLLTSEVSLSLWSFYWIMKVQLIVAYYLGFPPASLPAAIGSTAGAKTFIGYQQVGCYVAYVLILGWMAREHLGHVLRRAFGRAGSTPEEKQEAMSYPMAFWGFAISFCFLIGWSILAGVHPLLAVALWLSYLVIAVALTRVVAEAGLLFVQQGWLPLGTLAQITGTQGWMTAQSLAPASILQGSMITDLRAFLMPSFLQSFKLARDRGLQARRLMTLITFTVLLAYAVGLWMNVRLGYENGGLSLNSWFAQAGAYKPAGDAASLLNNLRDVSATNLVWLGLGMAMTYGMMLARSRLLWFPFHPVGLLMSLTYPMYTLWFSIFVGWLCKTLISKFGGSDAYRKLMPLFLGLVLGDVAMMIFWLVIDGWQSRIGHQLMPG